MTHVRINGNGFELATEWQADGVSLVFSDENGNVTGSAAVFDPDGPNAANGNLIGGVVTEWTNTRIELDYDGASYSPFITEVTLYDVTQGESTSYAIDPPAPTTPVTNFDVSFNSSTDILTFTSLDGLFDNLDYIEFEGEYPDGSPGWNGSISSGNYVVESNVTAYLEEAWDYLVASPGTNARLTEVRFYDAGSNLLGTFTGSVLIDEPAAPETATITAVTQPSPGAYNSRYVFGTGLDAPGLTLRVISDDTSFDKTWDLDNPAAPLYSSVQSGGTFIQLDDVSGDMEGKKIDYVQVRDSSNAVIFEWYASSQPTIFNICSPAPDTIRFEGKGFQNSPLGAVGYVIPRLAEYGSQLGGPAMQYEFADGSPDPVYEWELVTFTDEIIEISNPRFSTDEPVGGPGDFVVTGVAFHSADASSMYYFEPWGEFFNTPVDGSGGCMTSTATITNVEYDRPTDSLRVTFSEPVAADVGGLQIEGDFEGVVGAYSGAIGVDTVEDPYTVLASLYFQRVEKVTGVTVTDNSNQPLASADGLDVDVLYLHMSYDSPNNQLVIEASSPMLLDDGGPTGIQIVSSASDVFTLVIDDASNARITNFNAVMAGFGDPVPWSFGIARLLNGSTGDLWGHFADTANPVSNP